MMLFSLRFSESSNQVLIIKDKIIKPKTSFPELNLTVYALKPLKGVNTTLYKKIEKFRVYLIDFY